MKKYKINRENKEAPIPSDEVIAKYKNFKQLNVSYNEFTKRSKVPLYRNKKMFLFLLLIGLVAWLISDGFFDEEKVSKAQNTELSK